MIPSHQSYSIQRLFKVWCIVLLPFQSSVMVVVHGQAPTAGSCYNSINAVELAELAVTDFSVVRQYILCPETTYTIGEQDYYGTLQFDTGSHMIHLRPNLHVQCGDTGSRANNCVINGGSVQVDGTSFYNSNTTGIPLDNVMISGLSFTSAKTHHVRIDRPGNVIFRDCSFRESTNAIVPILLDHFDGTNAASVLNVTIQACEFSDITYFGAPAQAALIVGNSKQNRLLIANSNFTRNDMIFNNTNYERSSFLIESSGPVEMMRNCFQHNSLGVAPVGVYGATIVASDNFQYNSTGGVCQMSAYFTASSFAAFTPICAIFDANSCKAGSEPIVPTPTVATVAPTVVPTNSTIVSPSTSPPPTIPIIVAEPTLTPTQSLAVGNVTNSASLAPAPSSGMVFWTPAPVVSNITNLPALAPAAQEVVFNTTSASSLLLFKRSTWSYMLFGLLTMLFCNL